MKELTELIYNIDENRKFMVVFSLPRKWYCFSCEDDNRWRVREGKPIPSFRTRVVGISFWRNFFYSMRYPDKEKYEDKVVPVITSWNLVCESGHLIICDNTGYSHTRPYKFFWKDFEFSSDYLQLSSDNELYPFLPKIREDITALIKDIPDFEEKEVSR
jgi:hypothetical protein